MAQALHKGPSAEEGSHHNALTTITTIAPVPVVAVKVINATTTTTTADKALVGAAAAAAGKAAEAVNEGETQGAETSSPEAQHQSSGSTTTKVTVPLGRWRMNNNNNNKNQVEVSELAQRTVDGLLKRYRVTIEEISREDWEKDGVEDGGVVLAFPEVSTTTTTTSTTTKTTTAKTTSSSVMLPAGIMETLLRDVVTAAADAADAGGDDRGAAKANAGTEQVRANAQLESSIRLESPQQHQQIQIQIQQKQKHDGLPQQQQHEAAERQEAMEPMTRDARSVPVLVSQVPPKIEPSSWPSPSTNTFGRDSNNKLLVAAAKDGESDSVDRIRRRPWPPRRHALRDGETITQSTVIGPDGTVQSRAVMVTTTRARPGTEMRCLAETNTHNKDRAQQQQQQQQPQEKAAHHEPQQGSTSSQYLDKTGLQSPEPQPLQQGQPQQQLHRSKLRERWAQRRHYRRHQADENPGTHKDGSDDGDERHLLWERRQQRERLRELREAEAQQREATAAAYGFTLQHPTLNNNNNNNKGGSVGNHHGNTGGDGGVQEDVVGPRSVWRDQHWHDQQEHRPRRGWRVREQRHGGATTVVEAEEEEKERGRFARSGHTSESKRTWPPKGYLRRQELERDEPRHNV
ncbi:hypothetical protein EC968_007521 [Mortierella alpina]|nr:hypothetical protein EC968_007521 [Mortierella alpina]